MQLFVADDALWSTTHIDRMIAGYAHTVRSTTTARPAMKSLPMLNASFAPVSECAIGMVGVRRIVVRNNGLHVIVRQLSHITAVLLR